MSKVTKKDFYDTKLGTVVFIDDDENVVAIQDNITMEDVLLILEVNPRATNALIDPSPAAMRKLRAKINGTWVH